MLKPITVGRWYFLQWHVNEPPFDNAKLRQAFAHAIDRNRLNEITMRGQGTVSDGPTPPGLWWYDPDLKSYPHDPAQAKALLAEAGHPNGFEYVLSTPQVTVFQQINQLAAGAAWRGRDQADACNRSRPANGTRAWYPAPPT